MQRKIKRSTVSLFLMLILMLISIDVMSQSDEIHSDAKIATMKGDIVVKNFEVRVFNEIEFYAFTSMSVYDNKGLQKTHLYQNEDKSISVHVFYDEFGKREYVEIQKDNDTERLFIFKLY